MSSDAARSVKTMINPVAMMMDVIEMIRNALDAVLLKARRKRMMMKTMMAICPNTTCGVTMR